MRPSGIVWDLGGLFIQIHPERLPDELNQSNTEFSKIHHRFECGICSEFEFEQALLGALNSQKPAKEIWNQILGKWNVAALEEIRQYRSEYRMVLLSNTNAWHEEKFTQSLRDAGAEPLENYFDRVTLSHRKKMRKPDPEIFRQAIADQLDNKGQLITPRSWLFVDDSQENLNGAATLGLQTYLHPSNTSPVETMRRLGLLINQSPSA